MSEGSKGNKGDCAYFRKSMSAYIDDAAGEAESRALLEHTAECSSCRRELANLYSMRDMIKNVYAPKGEVDFSKSIMMRISPKELPVVHKRPMLNHLMRFGAAATFLFAAIAATVVYTQSEADKMVAEQHRFENYAFEHSTQSFGNDMPVSASALIPVNFSNK